MKVKQTVMIVLACMLLASSIMAASPTAYPLIFEVSSNQDRLASNIYTTANYEKPVQVLLEEKTVDQHIKEGSLECQQKKTSLSCYYSWDVTGLPDGNYYILGLGRYAGTRKNYITHKSMVPVYIPRLEIKFFPAVYHSQEDPLYQHTYYYIQQPVKVILECPNCIQLIIRQSQHLFTGWPETEFEQTSHLETEVTYPVMQEGVYGFAVTAFAGSTDFLDQQDFSVILDQTTPQFLAYQLKFEKTKARLDINIVENTAGFASATVRQSSELTTPVVITEHKLSPESNVQLLANSKPAETLEQVKSYSNQKTGKRIWQFSYVLDLEQLNQRENVLYFTTTDLAGNKMEHKWLLQLENANDANQLIDINTSLDVNTPLDTNSAEIEPPIAAEEDPSEQDLEDEIENDTPPDSGEETHSDTQPEETNLDEQVEENNPPVQHPGGRIVPGQIIRIWSAQPKDANLENTLQLQEEAVIEEKEIEASISSITNMRVSDSETQAKSEKPTNTAQATKNKIVFPVNSSWVLGLLFVLITLLLGYFFYSKTGSNTKNRQQLKKMQREVQFYKSQGDRHL